jgi:hypothetical protein
MTRRQLTIWVLAAIAVLAAGAVLGIPVTRAIELPPSGSQPLTVILESVERQNLGTIRSVEYEWWNLKGYWQISICKETCLKVYINPRSGKERRRESDDSDHPLPPTGAKGLGLIAKSLEDRKLGVITEIEFKHGDWEVQIRQDGKKLKLNVNPATGEVTYRATTQHIRLVQKATKAFKEHPLPEPGGST